MITLFLPLVAVLIMQFTVGFFFLSGQKYTHEAIQRAGNKDPKAKPKDELDEDWG